MACNLYFCPAMFWVSPTWELPSQVLRTQETNKRDITVPGSERIDNLYPLVNLNLGKEETVGIFTFLSPPGITGEALRALTLLALVRTLPLCQQASARLSQDAVCGRWSGVSKRVSYYSSETAERRKICFSSIVYGECPAVGKLE